MAWSEKLSSGRYRGGYRDRNRELCYTEHTYTQPAEAKAEAQRLEDRTRNRPAYRKSAGKVSYREWVDEWWPKRTVEPITLRQDWLRMTKHILPRWGEVPLKDLSEDRDGVQAWIDEKAGSKLSASTVAKIKALLSASMTAAIDDQRIVVNPCTRIKLPTIPPPDERYLERDEYAALREEMPTERDKLLCDLLVGTGLRWGEAVALHRPRIHRGSRSLDVMGVYDPEADAIKAYPKGKKKRSVPLEDSLAKLLAEWMANTPAECATPHLKGSTCRGGLLFSDDGAVLDYFSFEKYTWRAAVKRAKVGPLRIHDLRHTYASWLRQDGVGLDEIQMLLGHTSAQTTQRYAHIGTARWDTVRTALRQTPEPEATPAGQLEALAKLAEADPDRWQPVLEAARAAVENEGSDNAAPNLLHDDHETEGGKIVHMDRWRRSTGT